MIKCKRCGGVLRKPQPEAQYECEECGMVVAPEQLRE